MFLFHNDYKVAEELGKISYPLLISGHTFKWALLTYLAIGLFRLYDLSISQVINHLTCYKFECSHWLKYSLQSECCNFNQ